jgi:hypothetical protein
VGMELGHLASPTLLYSSSNYRPVEEKSNEPSQPIRCDIEAVNQSSCPPGAARGTDHADSLVRNSG